VQDGVGVGLGACGQVAQPGVEREEAEEAQGGAGF
jgi:hypothetical protein